jgi:betaine reductase
MHTENPGVEMYRQDAFICKTADNARGMREALRKMAQLALALTEEEKREGSLLLGINLPPPSRYCYFSRLILVNEFCEKTAAERSIDKLLAKLRYEPFETEGSLPKFEIVDPPNPVADASACEFALITDGGLVPRGNPDGLLARGNCKWAAYEMATIFTGDQKPSNIDVVHGGYFTDMVLGDPNRLLPVDVMYDLVKERKIGRLHPTFFSTSGNSTVARKCLEMGAEIASEIIDRGISAVILTST